MSRPFKGLLLTKECAKIVRINGTLEGYYKLLDCNIIEGGSVKFGDKWYDIICDEEGRFKPNNHVSICSEAGSPMFVGNIIVCNHNDKGEETSLTIEDIANLYRHIAWSEQNGEAVPVLLATV